MVINFVRIFEAMRDEQHDRNPTVVFSHINQGVISARVEQHTPQSNIITPLERIYFLQFFILFVLLSCEILRDSFMTN